MASHHTAADPATGGHGGWNGGHGGGNGFMSHHDAGDRGFPPHAAFASGGAPKGGAANDDGGGLGASLGHGAGTR